MPSTPTRRLGVVPTVSTAVLAGGTTLSFAERGDPSGAAVVFLPGPTDSWVSYRQVLELMPSTVRSVAVSQRGHGDSAKPSDGYRVDDFAADVPALLDALSIAEALLVGHSGSCFVARRVALDHPERVAGLVLEASPSTLVGDRGLTEFIDTVLSKLEDPIDPDFARSFVIDTSSPDLAPEFANDLVREVLKVPARVWREMFQALVRYDDREELGGIAAPILFLWGNEDPIVSTEAQEDLAARLPDARWVTYEGVGHTPRWENPSRFAADVTAFAEDLGRLLGM